MKAKKVSISWLNWIKKRRRGIFTLLQLILSISHLINSHRKKISNKIRGLKCYKTSSKRSYLRTIFWEICWRQKHMQSCRTLTYFCRYERSNKDWKMLYKEKRNREASLLICKKCTRGRKSSIWDTLKC